MNADLARLLAPHVQAVQDAQAALHEANRAPNGITATYAAAGRLIAAYEAYTGALIRTLDARDLGPICGCQQTLEIQGRLRRLHEERQK